MIIQNFTKKITNLETKEGRSFSKVIQLLIIASIVSFSIETLPDLSPDQKKTLNVFEAFCIIIFTFEYILRITAEKDKLKYIFSFYGLIDLLAIVPFYVSIGVDLRSLRIFRLFRLFRILKLMRYHSALSRFRKVIYEAKEELLLFLLLTFILIYLASVGIYFFEHDAQPEKFSSIFESLWWAVATLTTVGYGDVYPITLGGKVFTFLILIIGLGIITFPAGILASALSTISKIHPKE